MTGNANSVNIGKKPYHHGDLRAALISEGLAILSESDADSLSLRELARRVGVSAPSVYRHFPDKQALMTALAEEGLRRLGASQHQAAEAAGGGKAGFAATGRAYVRFALANPALYRLIFTSPLIAAYRASVADRPEAFDFLLANAGAAVGADPESQAARVAAVEAWALVHGLAMLMLDGQIPADEALIDAVC
jgi:AcrR family transcriptional regulator